MLMQRWENYLKEVRFLSKIIHTYAEEWTKDPLC